MNPDPLSKQFKKENDKHVQCIYAFNSKAISGLPVTGVTAGKKTVLRQTLDEIHQQLQCLFEMAEIDHTLLQSTCLCIDMVWCGTVRYGMVWYGMVWYGMVWYGMVWYGMVWYGMVWYGMVWYGMVWYGMVWYGMVWYGMVWYGMVWYGMVWYGMVWYGMVWYGMV